MSQVQTDADSAVHYALADNSLAITYCKQVRGVPVEEAQKGQLDSMMCAMESKFVLMKGACCPAGRAASSSGSRHNQLRSREAAPSKPAQRGCQRLRFPLQLKVRARSSRSLGL
jgi:hypothetical protein